MLCEVVRVGDVRVAVRVLGVLAVVAGVLTVAILSGGTLEETTDALFLPTNTPRPTLSAAESAQERQNFNELLEYLTDAARTPETFRPPRPQTEFFESHSGAEAKLAWRLLRHPEADSLELRVTVGDGFRWSSSVLDVTYVRGQSFELVQFEQPKTFLEVIDDSPSFTARVASFDVTFERDYLNNVEARFETGELDAVGQPIVASVTGGDDVEDVRRFISELTFGD